MPSSEKRKLAGRSGTESPAGMSWRASTSVVLAPVTGSTRMRSAPGLPGRRSEEKYAVPSGVQR